MRVGLGVTGLVRSHSNFGSDGIGTVTSAVYQQLRRYSSFEITPISFGYQGFDKIYPQERGLVLDRFSRLIFPTLVAGLSSRGESHLRKVIDVFHSTDHYIPRYKSIPIVATIHDAIPFSHPHWMTKKFRIFYAPIFRRSARWADLVTTVSNHSKQMIIKHFRLSPDRVVVIPNAVDKSWYCPADEAVQAALRLRYCIPEKYIVSVGTLQPRKNIERLVSAYLLLKPRIRAEFGLVVVGRPGWRSNKLVDMLEHEDSRKANIHWLKYIPQNHLEEIVKGASCLAFPSLAEGFGLPVLEGFAAKIPVVTSNLTAISEVAGDAAVQVNPFNTRELADGISMVLENESLASKLMQSGFHRSQYFSWERAVTELTKVYRSVI